MKRKPNYAKHVDPGICIRVTFTSPAVKQLDLDKNYIDLDGIAEWSYDQRYGLFIRFFDGQIQTYNSWFIVGVVANEDED